MVNPFGAGFVQVDKKTPGLESETPDLESEFNWKSGELWKGAYRRKSWLL
jgi:hypothetical protein